MTKKIFAISTLFALMGTVGANAANLRQDRILVQESISHAQSHRRPGDGQLRLAYDKLSIVQRDIYDLRPSIDKADLERALEDALRTISDRRLPTLQIADIVVRRGQDALVAINRLERDDRPVGGGARRELDRSLESLDHVSRMVRNLRFGEAQNELSNIQNILSRFQRDRDLEMAQRELDRLNQILGDRYRNPRMIQDETDRVVSVARDLILRSHTYTDRDDRPDQGRDMLGRTRPFGSRFATTEYIDVGREEGRMAGLEFTAREANIRIDQIEIVFGNGRSEVFHGGYIMERSNLRLDLRGNERLVQTIRVTAQSMGGGGGRPFGEGHFVIRAIR